MLNQVQRQRYEKVYYQLHAAVTVLEEMVEEYPPPEENEDEKLAFALEDLERRVTALTACWEGAG